MVTRPAARRGSGRAPAVVTALLVSALGCQDRGAPPISLVLDANEGKKITFSPKSVYADYVEIEDLRHELRITLASFAGATCDEYRAPEAGDTVVTLTLMTPPDAPPAPGDYPYGGVPDIDAPTSEPVVLPKVRHEKRGFLFQPGGSVKLTGLALEPKGRLSGRIDLSYPGDAEHPATRVQGTFSGWVCRYAPAPKR